MIGIDIVRIERIRRAAESEYFLQRVFSECEIEYAQKKHDFLASLSGIFAAKEACAKALGVGLTGRRLKEIEILHDKNGCPYGLIDGCRLEVSISHEGEYAVAVALKLCAKP